jgi:glucan 1,3-beta-glucosidase
MDGKYFTAPLPQYANYDISQVVSVKEDPEHRVYGDSESPEFLQVGPLLTAY